MEADEMEMTKVELQSLIRDKVQKTLLSSSALNEKFNLLRSLLSRNQRQISKLSTVCQSIAKCEKNVKELYSLLGWEYEDDSDESDAESAVCSRARPFLFVTSRRHIHKTPPFQTPSSQSSSSEDEEMQERHEDCKPPVIYNKKAVVVLTKLRHSQIAAALRTPTPPPDSSDEDVLNGSESDMQWEPETECIDSEFSGSDSEIKPHKRRKIDTNYKTGTKNTSRRGRHVYRISDSSTSADGSSSSSESNGVENSPGEATSDNDHKTTEATVLRENGSKTIIEYETWKTMESEKKTTKSVENKTELYKSKTPESGKSNSSKSGKLESGKIKSTESGKIKSTESGKIKSTESGKIKSTESGKIKSTESGKIKSTESGKIKSTESGKIKSTESGKIKSTESGKIKSTESGKIKSTESGKSKSMESGRIKSTDSGKSKSMESGRIKSTDSGKIKNTEHEERKTTESRKRKTNSDEKQTPESDKQKKIKSNTSKTTPQANTTTTSQSNTTTGPQTNADKTSTLSADIKGGTPVNSQSQKTTVTSSKVLQVEITVNMNVLARRRTLSWKPGKITEIITKGDGKVKYKVVFEEKGKSLVSSHHIALITLPQLDNLFVGARVVVKSESDQPDFKPGILAEVPSRKNRMRFLVFIDDHTPVYCSLPSLHLVCKPLADPLDDIPDENHRSYMREYLKAWPYPPVTQYKVGQVVNVQYNGVLEKCEVLEIDCSLIQVVFTCDQQKEWIFRGSMRLEHIVKVRKDMLTKINEEKKKDVEVAKK